MDAITYLKKQINSMQYLQDSVLQGLVDETMNQIPPGTVSPIGIIWLHMVNAEDNFISLLLRQQSLWDSGGWKERFGLEKAPDMGEDWSAYREVTLTVELMQDYQKTVRLNIESCLKQSKDETLDEEVKFIREDDLKADVWALLVSHSLTHTGEMAALKGVSGEKGLPF